MRKVATELHRDIVLGTPVDTAARWRGQVSAGRIYEVNVNVARQRYSLRAGGSS